MITNKKKKSDALGNIYIFFRTSYKKFHSKIQLHVKVFIGEKDMESFSKVRFPLAPSYRF
jgi:hypothetical protein